VVVIIAIDKVFDPAYNVRCTRGAIKILMMGSIKQGCLFREPEGGENRQAELLNSFRRSGGENE